MTCFRLSAYHKKILSINIYKKSRDNTMLIENMSKLSNVNPLVSQKITKNKHINYLTSSKFVAKTKQIQILTLYNYTMLAKHLSILHI